MPLPQDIVTRFTKVQWPGGDYVVFYFEGRGFLQQSAGDASNALTVTCPELGWNDKDLFDPNLTERVSPQNNNPLTDPVPQFSTPPGLLHSYTGKEEQRTNTTTASFHVLDRGLYNIIDRITGAVVTDGTGPFGTVEIPFIIDYTGDTSGGGGLDVRTPDGTTSYYSQLALAKAIAVGIGGVNWDCNLVTELAGHDEIGSYVLTNWVGDRLVFVNWTKLKAQLAAAGKKKVEFTFKISPGISAVGGKATYYGYIFLGIYRKQEGYKDWPLKLSADVSDTQFADMLQHSQTPVGGRTAFPPGSPMFNPPNDEEPGLPLRLGFGDGAVVEIDTSESKRGPGSVTISITRKDANAPGDPPVDDVVAGPVSFAF